MLQGKGMYFLGMIAAVLTHKKKFFHGINIQNEFTS